MPSSFSILFAEDDDDHYFLIQKIFKEIKVSAELHRVNDGEELLKVLRSGHIPSMVVLDINMPKMDGWEALAEIKSDSNLRKIPVVIMTTSENEEDKLRSYEMGANSFIQKPIELKKWMETFRAFNRYWFEIVDLPTVTGKQL